METANLELLRVRHRNEQRDLQSRMTQKKKAATKKTRKAVNSECEDLERQLKERQQIETASLKEEAVPNLDHLQLEDVLPATNAVVSQVDDEMTTTRNLPAELNESSAAPIASGQIKKRNRAKKRLIRRAAEQEAAVAEAEQEAANEPDLKEMERISMANQIKARGLMEKTIRPDGHCLFSAVADQLLHVNIPLGLESGPFKEDQRFTIIRKAAARFIEGHPEDFTAWLDEPLPDYVHKIRDTAEWGGHLELLALAKAYNVEICVLQNGAPEYIKPDVDSSSEAEKIWLAYYRHGYGLGEHYNSLRKAP